MKNTSSVIGLVILYIVAIINEVLYPQLRGINLFIQGVLFFRLFRGLQLVSFSKTIFLMLKAYFIVFIFTFIGINISKEPLLLQFLKNPFFPLVIILMIGSLLFADYWDKRKAFE